MSDPVTDAVAYRKLQAYWDHKADAYPHRQVTFEIQPGKTITRLTFEYKQMRRRAGGYAAQARRCEDLAAQELSGV